MEVHPPALFARNHNPSPSMSGRFTAFMSGNPHSSSTQYSSYSQLSSLRSSDSTAATSNSTLFNAPPIPTPTPVSTPFGANDSVLNRRADESQSLFQICVQLRQRLIAVPGFEEELLEEEEAEAKLDPVSIVWRFLRRGLPLLALFNALGQGEPLEVDPNKVKEAKRPHAASVKFIGACKSQLGITDAFIVSDLFGDDTTGIVKVIRVVNQVLDILVQRGIIGPEAEAPEAVEGLPGTKRTNRQHIIAELVTTERTYVQHLQLLQAFKNLVEQKGVISGDAMHDIFHNLNALLDFQQRFLIRVEQTNLQPEEEQNWGGMFTLYKDAFKVYEPYIANQKKSEAVAMREFGKLSNIGGPPELQQFVDNPTVLSAFLLKPFQRLSKYPLLLKELLNKGDLDEERKHDVEVGIEAATSILLATNAAIDRQERNDAMYELRERVEDWKGHKLDSFGDLLLHGTYQVIKGDTSNPKDQEREYKIFLFEQILLCCKEVNANKQKNKVLGKNLTDAKGRPRLQLKGRIFMQNVTDTIISAKPGSYTCQIFWKGDPGIEYFTIKFNAEEVMRKWADQVNSQRRSHREQQRSSSRATTVVPDTEFYSLRDQTLENPHKMYHDDDEDDDYETGPVSGYPAYGNYPITRNESQTSFRSRSTTGESINRMPPRQFPLGSQTPQLSVRTGGQGYLGDSGDSYFSPATESPISTRSSGLSGMSNVYGYRQSGAPPVPGTWEDHRYTAPAMPRQQVNSYQPNPRTAVQRPSLPPSAHSVNGMSVHSRLRSASSPDIANPLRRYDPAQVPPMPDLPTYPQAYAYPTGVLERSQSSSPAQGMTTLPMRSNTQSPGTQQARLAQGGPRSIPSALQAGQPEFAMGMAQRQMSYIQPGMMEAAMQPSLQAPAPITSPAPSEGPLPSQLKVKVHCHSAGTSMTFVVSPNITFQSLKDRIDVKLQRSTNLSLSSGQVKLKYLDDDDYISISSDEDVQMAFETWRESQRAQNLPGIGEIDLYIQ